MARVRLPVCESCKEALREEPGARGMNDADVEQMCRELGADITDHECDAADNDEPCGCRCQRPR